MILDVFHVFFHIVSDHETFRTETLDFCCVFGAARYELALLMSQKLQVMKGTSPTSSAPEYSKQEIKCGKPHTQAPSSNLHSTKLQLHSDLLCLDLPCLVQQLSPSPSTDLYPSVDTTLSNDSWLFNSCFKILKRTHDWWQFLLTCFYVLPCWSLTEAPLPSFLFSS